VIQMLINDKGGHM